MPDQNFEVQEFDAGTHKWCTYKPHPLNCNIQELAFLIAVKIMKLSCVGVPKDFESWYKKVTEGVDSDSETKSILESHLTGIIRLNSPENHKEGLVAEHLWHLVHDQRNYILLRPPSLFVTGQGGDGFSIHRNQDGDLQFRIWEIKKSIQAGGAKGVKSTIKKCTEQLKKQGNRYMAKFTAICDKSEDEELKNFCADMERFWHRSTPNASIGVAIFTNTAIIPSDEDFSVLATSFPKLARHNTMRGFMCGLDDFNAFSSMVVDILWSGV
jgi:hypothetical protein